MIYVLAALAAYMATGFSFNTNPVNGYAGLNLSAIVLWPYQSMLISRARFLALVVLDVILLLVFEAIAYAL